LGCGRQVQQSGDEKLRIEPSDVALPPNSRIAEDRDDFLSRNGRRRDDNDGRRRNAFVTLPLRSKEAQKGCPESPLHWLDTMDDECNVG
jgi:hypothetical protein